MQYLGHLLALVSHITAVILAANALDQYLRRQDPSGAWDKLLWPLVVVFCFYAFFIFLKKTAKK